MIKKIAYERPTLTRAGAFGALTAGTLFGCDREAFWTQRPKFLCS